MGTEEVTIGGYRLLRRLGFGGMAETFEAEPLDLARGVRRVCIKRLLPAQAEDPSIREAFHREARLLETLDHTKIVRVLDHFGEAGSECMVLELVNGVDLRALLAHEAGGLPPDDVEAIAVDLLRALEHAHASRGGAEGIVHRDVSSSNVLISVDGEARLTDFGIAKELEGTHVAASTGVRGKVPYMSPEQLRGEAASPKSDLFSLGIVLYEALAGRRPFGGTHDVEAMSKILGDERPPIAELAGGPAPLLALIESLLAFDPADRPASASDALRAFDGLVEEPVARLRLGARAAQVKPKLRTHTPLPFAPSVAGQWGEPRGSAGSVPATRVYGEPPASAARPGRTATPMVAIAGLVSLVAALGLGAGALVSLRESAPAEAPRPAPEPERGEMLAHPAGGAELAVNHETPASPLAPEPAPPKAPAPDAAPEPPGPSEAADEARSGLLRVIVIPWGKVWIDGVPHGRAPRSVRLPPGVHRVGAGIDGVEKRARVRVRPGGRHTVEIDLSGG